MEDSGGETEEGHKLGQELIAVLGDGVGFDCNPSHQTASNEWLDPN